MSVKKVLVVCAFSYETLTSILDDFELSLKKELPDEKYEFYIVNVIYHGEKPKNLKYKYYIHSSDCNNLEELERLAQEVKKWNIKFDYSFQISEYAIEILGYINSKLNFKGLSFDDAQKFRDKVVMKNSLGDSIRKPKLYTMDDIQNDNVKYPVIVKPRSFACSWGVKKISNKAELLEYLKDKNFDYNRICQFKLDDVEVEEYIDAPMYHVDGLVFNGKVFFSVSSQYITTCLEYAHGTPCFSIKCNDEFEKKGSEFINKVNKALKIPNGAFTLEGFWHNNEFVFGEIAIRYGGGGVVPVFEKVYGINLINEHIKFQLGINNINIANNYKYYGWIWFPRPIGLQSDKYIKSIQMNYKPKSLILQKVPEIGEKVNAGFVEFARTLGSFVFVSNNRDELLNEVKQFEKEYKIEY